MKSIVKHRPFALLLAGVLVLLSACGGSTAADDVAAVDVVRAFVAAWEAGDTGRVIDLLEPADWRNEIGPEVRAYTGRMQQLTFKDPTYTLLDNNGSLAHVQLHATLAYRVQQEISGERAITVLVEVVKVDDAWYIRNVDMSQSFEQ